MDNLNAYSNISVNFFEIGNFCVVYSSKYFEFYRARILNIDYQSNKIIIWKKQIQTLNLDKQCLIIYVDFGNSEWIHIKAIRPLHIEFAKLNIQSIAVTLSHVC